MGATVTAGELGRISEDDVTAIDAHVRALIEQGRHIDKVPWTWDENARSAAAAVLQRYGITERETQAEAQARIQRMARGQM